MNFLATIDRDVFVGIGLIVGGNGPLVMGFALLACGIAVLVNVAVRHW